ncbi:hypothetical protein CRV08_07730 [Halarcobacter ebronensis]|uniref:Pentapeptide repeat-containing protein n=1 Tax=Halarcobacter ebronensis TaxID=1462615 RepID=A0A4Q0YCL7_9BACT|nr:pentapeptide repeat-containing protein [Halarcobacter ebronensis]RXJ68140.1 hypothetical protein CRV08_07730 [Halarcobacter ebronensis]
MKSILVLFFLISSLFAYNQKDLDKFLNTKVCQNCDLSNANLSGKEFQNSDLSGTNLSGANLSKSDFLKSNLWGANLTNANLSDTNLRASNLSAVEFKNVNCNNTTLKGANLSNASLSNIKCKNLSLWGATFLDTTLEEVDFSKAGAAYANFNGVDFSKTVLEGGIFWNAKFINSTFTKTQCKYLKTEEAILDGAECN